MKKCTCMVEPERPQKKIWRMRIAYWIPKATDTRTQNMKYLSLFHCINCCKKAHVCRLLNILQIYEHTHYIPETYSGYQHDLRTRNLAK